MKIFELIRTIYLIPSTASHQQEEVVSEETKFTEGKRISMLWGEVGEKGNLTIMNSSSVSGKRLDRNGY